MAVVDFSNAVLAPFTTNPVEQPKVGLNDSYNPSCSIVDASNTGITSSLSKTLLTNESNLCVMNFSGTFSASGTAFYISQNGIHWRVSNVTFASGDTFNFQIELDLVNS